MTEVLSKRNRFKVNRVDSGDANSEEDGDDSEVYAFHTNHPLSFIHYKHPLFCV